MNAKHFWRTIHFGQKLNLDIAGIFEKASKNNLEQFEKDLGDLLKCEISKVQLNQTHVEMLQEIQAIEMEKYRLRDSEQSVTIKFEKEIELSFKREELLLMDCQKIVDIPFTINPEVKIYESFWKWIVKESELEMFNWDGLFEQSMNDYYFLFMKTGTYDQFFDTNVFEYPLSAYQYYLLRLFEKPNKMQWVINEFIKAFDISTLKQKKQFLLLTTKLLKELIFKKYLIVKPEFAILE